MCNSSCPNCCAGAFVFWFLAFISSYLPLIMLKVRKENGRCVQRFLLDAVMSDGRKLHLGLSSAPLQVRCLMGHRERLLGGRIEYPSSFFVSWLFFNFVECTHDCLLEVPVTPNYCSCSKLLLLPGRIEGGRGTCPAPHYLTSHSPPNLYLPTPTQACF